MHKIYQLLKWFSSNSYYGIQQRFHIFLSHDLKKLIVMFSAYDLQKIIVMLFTEIASVMFVTFLHFKMYIPICNFHNIFLLNWANIFKNKITNVQHNFFVTIFWCSSIFFLPGQIEPYPDSSLPPLSLSLSLSSHSPKHQFNF